MRTIAWATLAWCGSAASGQELVAPPAATPFTGDHVTLNRAPAAAPNAATTIVEGAAGPAANNYLNLEFLVWKATGPRNKFPLFQLAETGTLQPLDTYRAGTFGSRPSAGFRGTWGRWADADHAGEVVFLWLDDYFYRREHAGFTTTGLFGGTSTVVQFVPANQTIDRYRVRYRLENVGVEANWRTTRAPGNDWLAGLRYHNLNERFSYTYDLPATTAPAAAAARGLQLGGDRTWALAEHIYLRANLKGMLALNLQGARIGGSSGSQGLLTSDSNRGYEERFQVSTLVDFGLSVVGHLAPNLQASVGAGGMYFGGVVRGANLIDQGHLGGAFTRRLSNDDLLLFGLICSLKFDY